MNKQVLISIDDRGLAEVTLNRAEVRNAFDEEMIALLTEAFANLGADPKVRMMVLRGAGKAFSGGGDINWMKRMANNSWDENFQDAEKLALMLKTLDRMPKPTLALVHGAAYGGGVGLVSACDIVIASQDASFCLSEVKIGLIPAVISPYVLRAMGERAARRYFLTAEVIGPELALSLNLVHELLADSAELEDAKERIFTAIRQAAPTSMGDTKNLIHQIGQKPVDAEVIKTTARAIADRRASAEGREGTQAFLQKRKAAWVP